MRLLFDQNLSSKLCARLSDLFPGSTQAHLVGLDRADNRARWDHAASEGLMLVSQDADCAEMAALHGSPPKVIWRRGGNHPTSAVEAAPRRHHVAIFDFTRDPEAACLELLFGAPQADRHGL